MNKIQCPHIGIYSQAHKVFDRGSFKHTQAKNKACITIGLQICQFATTSVHESTHQSKGLLFGCNGARVKVWKNKERKHKGLNSRYDKYINEPPHDI